MDTSFTKSEISQLEDKWKGNTWGGRNPRELSEEEISHIFEVAIEIEKENLKLKIEVDRLRSIVASARLALGREAIS